MTTDRLLTPHAPRERVVRMPPGLLAGAHQAVRVGGKSDPRDALAVARAALREPCLPVAGHDRASWEVKALVDHREPLVAERTRQINRLRWHLHQLNPDLEHATRRLPGPGLRRIAAWLAQATPSVQVQICLAQVTAISVLTGAAGRDRRRGPLSLRGLLCDARRRGPGPGRLRAHRPPPPVSGVATGSSTARCTASRSPSCGCLALARPTTSGRAQGDAVGEAVRSLKRRIARAVYQRLWADQSRNGTGHTAAA
jgi:transposase